MPNLLILFHVSANSNKKMNGDFQLTEEDLGLIYVFFSFVNY